MNNRILLLGAAGTGKTYRCLKRLVESRGNDTSDGAILLLPSKRAINSAEKTISKFHGSNAIESGEMADFSTLSLIITHEAGVPVPDFITPSQKLFLLRDIVAKTGLDYFKESSIYPGFSRSLGNFFKELGQSMCRPEQMEKILEPSAKKKVSFPFTGKLGEIRLLYDEYRKKIAEMNLIDDEILLEHALDILISNKDILGKRKVLLVDGFMDFTNIEFEILTIIMDRIPEVIVALCYRHDDPEKFKWIDNTYRRLKELGKWQEEVLTDNRRTKDRQLLAVDTHVFIEEPAEKPEGGSVVITEATDGRYEADAIASEILRLHIEDSIPFGSIGIILRSPEDYAGEITDALHRKKIPCSGGNSESAISSPLSSLALLLCDNINEGFCTDLLLKIARTGLTGIKDDTVDALDEYVKANGITTEAHWNEDWHDAEKDVLSARDRVVALLPLRDEALKQTSAVKHSDIIIKAIDALGFDAVQLITLAWENPALRNNVTSITNGLRALYSACDEIVLFCNSTNRENLTFAEFSEMLEVCLQNISIGSTGIADAVGISGIFESRSPEYRVVFIPGLCEKSFPRTIRNDPYLKDRERDDLRKKGIDLPSRLNRTALERYLFYIACTRASEKLYLSHPATGKDGRISRRSHYIDEILKITYAVETKAVAPDLNVPDKWQIYDRNTLYKLAAGIFYTVPSSEEEKKAIYTSSVGLMSRDIMPEDFSNRVLAYGCREDDRIGKPSIGESAKKLLRKRLGDEFIIRVTALESFAKCPFRYFCEVTLNLREPDVLEFSPQTTGSAYHDTMRDLYREIFADKKEMPSPETITERGIKILDDIFRRDYARLSDNPRVIIDMNISKKRFKNFLKAEEEFLRNNTAKPCYFEISFNPKKTRGSEDVSSVRKGLKLTAENGISAILTGRIDRVDVFETGGVKCGIVIDYKSGSKQKPDFEKGKDLQIPLYIHAVEKLLGVTPAGGFYYYIKDIKKAGLFDNAYVDYIQSSTAGRDKKSNPVSDNNGSDLEGFKGIIDSVIEITKDYIRRIHDGDISFGDDPDCNYCPFNSICRREVKFFRW